ncbi:MAG: SCO family protein [Alphaproteobacteria bacterium]|nr:SCO family protein [Alphaproteobacteria bacterium]
MSTRLIAVLLAATLVVPAGAGAAQDTTAPPLEALFGGPFTLVDHRGESRTDADFRGRHMLIYFGYTYCPDICPTGLQEMAAALDLLGDTAGRVQPLFVSIDPARDTPAVLGDYVGLFHPDLTGLTGSEAQVAAAAKAYRIHRVKVPGVDGDAVDYLVNHSSITYLMGPDGRFLTLFPHGTKADVMAAALANYLD